MVINLGAFTNDERTTLAHLWNDLETSAGQRIDKMIDFVWGIDNPHVQISNRYAAEHFVICLVAAMGYESTVTPLN